MQNEMRDRLVELFYENNVRCDQTIEHLVDDVMSIFENDVIVPPCKVGDYIEWENGIEKTLYQVKGFLYYENSLRYVLDFFEPVVTHQAITGILTKEEAEQKLKGGADNG